MAAYIASELPQAVTAADRHRCHEQKRQPALIATMIAIPADELPLIASHAWATALQAANEAAALASTRTQPNADGEEGIAGGVGMVDSSS